jgi:pimeloyl-ACP methyl ester carboxylesterase
VPVLYLHPIGLDRYLWEGVATESALTPDFPGFGAASLDGKPSFSALVEFVAGLLPGPADIVGVSLGSMVAQHVAVERPDLVRSLVLACGSARANAEASLERWLTPAALSSQGHPGVTYVRKRLLSDDPEVFASYWEEMAQHDMLDSLSQIRVPTTVIAADGDRAVSVPDMAEIASRIPGARFEVMAGPHILPLENGVGFRDAVARHLELAE